MNERVTGEQVKSAMQAAGIDRAECGACSICGYSTAYIRHGDHLFFDVGCYCTTGSYEEPRSFEEAANWINMQPTATERKNIAARFGVALFAE